MDKLGKGYFYNFIKQVFTNIILTQENKSVINVHCIVNPEMTGKAGERTQVLKH